MEQHSEKPSRDIGAHFTTAEYAEAVHVKQQTIRRGYCVDGHYLGIQPVKLSNRRLLWPIAEIRRILAGGAR